MPLTIPGSSTGQLVSSAAPANSTGISLLEPRFLSLLQQNDVPEENMAKLGAAGCKTMALFGHIGGKDEARLEAYLKAVLNLNSQARPEDFIPIAQLVIVWTACKKRAEVETEVQAQRVVTHLPPQLTAEDHAAARDALEHRLKRPVPDHKIPSENYFQRKVGEVEGKFNPDKLTEVTNVTQEEAQKKPKGQAASTNYLDFDDTGRPTGLKSKTTDFWVPVPHNEATFKNRFEVMDHLYTMLQMRFSSNPILATYEVGMFKEYCEDYLCGERVWAFVIRGDNNEPISSPSLRQVCNYDFQLRGLMTRLMRKKVDIKTALERAMNDQDTRTLYFTAGFTMESNTAECEALSAPLPRGDVHQSRRPQGLQAGARCRRPHLLGSGCGQNGSPAQEGGEEQEQEGEEGSEPESHPRPAEGFGRRPPCCPRHHGHPEEEQGRERRR